VRERDKLGGVCVRAEEVTGERGRDGKGEVLGGLIMNL